jgi:hypothetical protein
MNTTIRLDQLKLSTRARYVIERAGLTTIESLVTTAPIDLIKFRNCGKVTLFEIFRALNEVGISEWPGIDRFSVSFQPNFKRPDRWEKQSPYLAQANEMRVELLQLENKALLVREKLRKFLITAYREATK